MLSEKPKEFEYVSTRNPLKPSTSFCRTRDGRYEKAAFIEEREWGESLSYAFKDEKGEIKKVVKKSSFLYFVL